MVHTTIEDAFDTVLQYMNVTSRQCKVIGAYTLLNYQNNNIEIKFMFQFHYVTVLVTKISN